MKMLSIDPSSSALGLAYFKDDKPQWCKTLVQKESNILQRMAQMVYRLKEDIDLEQWDYIAIETPYMGLSKSTSIKMGEIFGIIVGVLFSKGYGWQQIIEVHPMTAKKAVGVSHFKNREEGKETILSLMINKFPELTITDDNSSDALAIGLAALGEIYEREPNKIS